MFDGSDDDDNIVEKIMGNFEYLAQKQNFLNWASGMSKSHQK